jgi:hypothetical protein
MQPEIAEGDVVQLDPEHSRWGRCSRSWRCSIVRIGYIPTPDDKKIGGLAHVRVNHEHYARIGVARWIAQMRPRDPEGQRERRTWRGRREDGACDLGPLGRPNTQRPASSGSCFCASLL